MELGLYAVLVLTACILSVGEKAGAPITRKEAGASFAALLLATFAIRSFGLDGDMGTYAERMSWSTNDLYYLREPVVWYSHRAIFHLTGSRSIALLTTDVLGLSLMVLALYKFRLPRFAIFAFFCFFPIILGMQNVYRQWLASCFLLYALASAKDNHRLSLASLILAALCHNSAVLFWGPIIAAGTMRWRVPLIIASVIVTPIAIFFGADTKSAAETGFSLEWLYVALIGASCVAMAWAGAGRRYTQATYFMFGVSYLSSMVLESAGSERVSLSAFVMIWPMLVKAMEDRITPMWPARPIIAVSGFLPLLATSARHVLF